MGGGGALKTAKVKVGKSEVGAKTSKPKSQFHIMANTNISSKQFNSWDEEKKENFVYYMGQFGEYIKNNYKMLVNTPSPKDLNTLKITSLSLNIEVQPKNGALHLDGYIFFNKFCQWRDRYKHINVAWECFVKKAGGKKGIFNAAFIPDYVTNAKEYSKKDKMPVFNFVDD
jgi:hypothetical protein